MTRGGARTGGRTRTYDYRFVRAEPLPLDDTCMELEEGFEPPAPSLLVRNSDQTELFQLGGPSRLRSRHLRIANAALY